MRGAMRSLLQPVVKGFASAIVERDHAAIEDLSSSFDVGDGFEVPVAEVAESARRQVADILGLDVSDFDVDFDAEVDDAIGNLNGIAIDALADLVDRADELMDQDDFDPDEIEGGLSGAMGTAFALVSAAFARGFASFNRAAQEEAGVDGYVWTSLHDDKVRPEHENLDGIEFGWDDPPLGADESSNGEDCNPGDDFNCRCSASPVIHSENESEESSNDEDSSEPE